jgi:RhoGEF domain
MFIFKVNRRVSKGVVSSKGRVACSTAYRKVGECKKKFSFHLLEMSEKVKGKRKKKSRKDSSSAKVEPEKKPLDIRKLTLKEIVQTETEYVRDLDYVVELFLEPLRKSKVTILPREEIPRCVFSST